MSILRYTGYPLVDVGVATIVAACKVERPEELTSEQIDTFIEEIMDVYMRPGVAGHLTNSVFANAGFANPNQINDHRYDASRKELLRALLHLWRPQSCIPEGLERALPGDTCVFSGDAASIRTSQMYIPMVTKRTDINFLPEGKRGLPISGWCLLAILSMPMGALKYRTRLIVVHGAEPDVFRHFASRNLERNRMAFHVQRLNDLPLYSFARTYIIDDLLHCQHYPRQGNSLTAYEFESKSKDAHMRVFHLPSGLISFIQRARIECPEAWDFVVRYAAATYPESEKVTSKKTTKKDVTLIKAVQTFGKCNYFYEDLFDLPRNARSFLRQYFLRTPKRIEGNKPKGDERYDPRISYSYSKERKTPLWPLTEIFLERIMRMDKQRIRKIRDLGQELASYIQNQDRRLFKELFTARSSNHFLLAILKAANSAPGILVRYDDFIDVFFVDDGETLRLDWNLARDLLMVRIIELLHDSEWIKSNQDLIEATDEEISTLEQV